MQALDTNLLNKFITDLYSNTKDKDIDIQNGLNVFYKHVEANQRIDTLRYYKGALSDITSFLIASNVNTFMSIKTEHINNYINVVRLRIKPQTINKRVKALIHVGSILKELNLISSLDITFKKLKEIPTQIEIVEDKTIKILVSYIKTKPYIQKLAFLILIVTGIRRKELLFLKYSKVNFDEKSIFLEHTKNGKPRLAFLNDEILKLIKDNHNNETDFLFNEKGRQLSISFIQSLFFRTKKELNIEMLSPHKFRHTFATKLAENNADLETMRLLLGHSDYSQILKYVHIKDERLKEFSSKSNPLNYL